MNSEDGPLNLVEALGTSEIFLSFQEALSRVAGVDRPVLIIGERGTGKELAAARLHYLSTRWQKPLITVNCAALSESLLESELFGHEAGSFTGAAGKRAGRFEQADGGTLFLDEIGAMPLRMQESILRVVEYGSFQRVGSSRSVQVDVRIIAATNADLPAMAARNTFKRDLLDRLCFEVLTLPPLRERGEDILLLAERFASSMAVELGLAGYPEFKPGAVMALHSHMWPGNIRELKNTIERAVFRSGLVIDTIPLSPFDTRWKTTQAHPEDACDSETHTISRPEAGGELPPQPADTSHASKSATDTRFPADLSLPLHEALQATEQRYVRTALLCARHNQRQAAGLLGLSYDQFRGLYRKHKKAIEGA